MIALVLAISTAACGTPMAGRAIPEARPIIESPVGEHTKAPPVPRPLDAEKYVNDPCASLTATQQAEFNVTSSRVNSDGRGSGCIWNVGDGSTSPGVSYLTSVDTGLSNLYALNDTGWWDRGYFEPTEVDGYPAVYVDLTDLRAQGDCGLAVALSDRLFFDVSIRTTKDNDACLGAKNVAEAILQTIKEGA
ncbi:DUF3558 domain-containing protein [Saccharothrix sp. AJ9571]|nr:DUF3558 domain-containing protein [Saccharothrix sp. AJ9571]